MSRTTIPRTMTDSASAPASAPDLDVDLGQARYDDVATSRSGGRASTAQPTVRGGDRGRPWMAMLTLVLAATGVVLGAVALARDIAPVTPIVPTAVTPPPSRVAAPSVPGRADHRVPPTALLVHGVLTVPAVPRTPSTAGCRGCHS